MENSLELRPLSRFLIDRNTSILITDFIKPYGFTDTRRKY